jgi:hypothetical protein
MVDVNCRIGKEQVEVLHLFDVRENWNAKGYNSDDTRTQQGQKL